MYSPPALTHFSNEAFHELKHFCNASFGTCFNTPLQAFFMTSLPVERVPSALFWSLGTEKYHSEPNQVNKRGARGESFDGRLKTSGFLPNDVLEHCCDEATNRSLSTTQVFLPQLLATTVSAFQCSTQHWQFDFWVSNASELSCRYQGMW